jgi:hypothetical protein
MASSFEGGEPRPSSLLVWLTLLSLDAPVVAVLWQRLFARCLNVRLSAAVTATLAIAVWLLYVLDRILDSMRAPARVPETLRHRFYRAYRRFFLPPFFAALAAGAWLAFFRLDKNTVETGLVLMLAVGVYFFSVHFRPPGGESRLPKEMVVAALFAAGTSFPVWQAAPGAHGAMLPPLLIFAFLCWANCAAIEYSEKEPQVLIPDQPRAEGVEHDWGRERPPHAERAGALHFSTIWLGRNLGLLGLAAVLGSLAWLAFPFARLVWPLYAAEAISATAIVWLARHAAKMQHDLFRILMDVALLSPVFFLWFGGR